MFWGGGFYWLIIKNIVPYHNVDPNYTPKIIPRDLASGVYFDGKYYFGGGVNGYVINLNDILVSNNGLNYQHLVVWPGLGRHRLHFGSSDLGLHIIGGCNLHACFADEFILDTKTLEFTVRELPFNDLGGGAVLKFETGGLILAGGHNSVGKQSDQIWRLSKDGIWSLVGQTPEPLAFGTLVYAEKNYFLINNNNNKLFQSEDLINWEFIKVTNLPQHSATASINDKTLIVGGTINSQHVMDVYNFLNGEAVMLKSNLPNLLEPRRAATLIASPKGYSLLAGYSDGNKFCDSVFSNYPEYIDKWNKFANETFNLEPVTLWKCKVFNRRYFDDVAFSEDGLYWRLADTHH